MCDVCHLCVCVCVGVCVCVCVVCVYVCVYVHEYEYVHVFVYVYVYVYVYVHVHEYEHAYVQTCVYVYEYACVYVYVSQDAPTQVHKWMHGKETPAIGCLENMIKKLRGAGYDTTVFKPDTSPTTGWESPVHVFSESVLRKDLQDFREQHDPAAAAGGLGLRV